MSVLVSGASGFVGSALVPLLNRAGHEVTPLTRGSATEAGRAPWWNPAANQIDLGPGPIDAVVHLAGENIAQRWTAEARKRIRESRVDATRLLCGALARQSPGPRVLIAASAIGIYGHRGDEVLSESSPPGTGFLAELCREWEAAARPAIDAGIRVVHLRLGVLLDASGGALKKMLPAFRAGIAGRLWSGKQFMSWATRHDALRAIIHTLDTTELAGPFNVVTPNPITNAEFTRALARILKRPAIFAAPRFVLRLAFGEMADEALLASARVVPERLERGGFRFEDAEIEPALRKLLARP